MQDSPKTRRPRAETPKGFRDSFGAEVAERNAMLERIAEVYHRHGFDALETSAVETVEALGKFLPDVDRPNAGVFAWQEEAVPGGGSGDWLALRYDLTAPLARVAAQHRNDLPSPYRRYAMGPVWRNEKPGPGRFRQFYQCDADTVGSASPAADAEIIAMLAEALEAAGIARGDYLVRVNSRKVLNGVLEAVGVAAHTADKTTGTIGRDGSGVTAVVAATEAPDTASMTAKVGVSATLAATGSPDTAEMTATVGSSAVALQATAEASDSAETAAAVLRTIDKFDKVGAEGVRQLLTTGRRDESGAVIEGVGLTDEAAAPVLGFLTSRDSTNAETLANLRAAVGASAIGAEGVAELEQIARLLEAMGLGPDRVVIDPSVVRGLAYYTGAVFEAELTFEVLDEKGRKRQFGSVAGGGRYDDLVQRFTGQKVPATGVSIGVDRLLTALREKGLIGGTGAGPVVVTVMDRERMADYLGMAAELRAAGIRAEVYLGNPKNFGNQLKYADRRAAPIAVIQGADEAARGVVQLKDLALGAKLAAEASHEEWKAQPAQTEVPREGLVAGVRAILNRAASGA